MSLREIFKRWCLKYLFQVQMKPIYKFNEFKKKDEIFNSSWEKTVWMLKIFSFTENMCHLGKLCHFEYVKGVSLGVCLLYNIYIYVCMYVHVRIDVYVFVFQSDDLNSPKIISRIFQDFKLVAWKKNSFWTFVRLGTEATVHNPDQLQIWQGYI